MPRSKLFKRPAGGPYPTDSGRFRGAWFPNPFPNGASREQTRITVSTMSASSRRFGGSPVGRKCWLINASPIRPETQGGRFHRRRSVGRTNGMKGAHNPGQPDQPIRPAALICEGMPADSPVRSRYQVSHGRRRRHTYQSAGDIACSSSSTKPLERKSSSYSASECLGGSNHAYGYTSASISGRSGWSL